MNKPQQISLAYRMLHSYVKWFYTRLYCRTYEVLGVEKLPVSGPLLFVTNHQNNLPDALSILFATPRKPVFVARADMFRNPKAIRALRFLRILPMYRADHGTKDLLSKLPATMQDLKKELLSGGSCVIMAEGSSSPSRELRPFKKGWARLYLDTLENETLVQIIPTALEYSQWNHWGPDVRINLGTPLTFKRHMDESDSQFLFRINAAAHESVKALLRDDGAIAAWHQQLNQKHPRWKQIASAPAYGVFVVLYAPLLWLTQRKVNQHPRADFKSTLEVGFIGLGGLLWSLLLAALGFAILPSTWALIFLIGLIILPPTAVQFIFSRRN